MSGNKEVGRVNWRLKLLSDVKEGEKNTLFTRVKQGETLRLFENLNDRLEVKSDGTVTIKENYNDGYFPVLEVAGAQPQDPFAMSVPVCGEKKVYPQIENVVTDVPEMASANFSLELVSIEERIDESTRKNSIQKFYVFRIKTDYGISTKAVAVSDLERFLWVQEATDGLAYFKDKKDYSKFSGYVHRVIEKSIVDVRKETLYEFPGWKCIDSRWCYVCDKGVIGKPEIRDVRTVSDLKFVISATPLKETIPQFWGMENICRRKDISRMLMLFSCMSVMTTLFEVSGFPIKTLLAVLGTTNTLKTSMSLVFTKIFNAEEITSPEVTFSSTRAGIETFVAKYQDAVLLVDDFMPGDDRAKQAELNAKLELLCRLYGDRTSKKRMTAFSTVKNVEYPVRGCCLVTGEHMTGVVSSQTRIVCLNIEKGDVSKETLGFYQANPLILPTFLKGFIEFLTFNQNAIREAIKRNMSEYREKLKFKIARLNEAAAHFLVTLDFLADYVSRNMKIDCEKFREDWKKSVVNIFNENDDQLATLDVTGVILQALEDALQSRRTEVKLVTEIQKDDICFAYLDENFVYVQQKELFLVVKNYCSRYGHNIYLQPKSIVAKLKERGVLECVKNSEGHLEAARKLQQRKGITRRFLYIKRKVMQEILEKLN